MMTKKQLLLLAIIFLPVVVSAAAYDANIDGIFYNLYVDTRVAEVTSNPVKYSGNVIIPESVIYDDIEYNYGRGTGS